MTGWTPITLPMDWQTPGFVNEFINAINERLAVLGFGPWEIPWDDRHPSEPRTVIVCDDIQWARLWAALQGGVDFLTQDFVGAINYGFLDATNAANIAGFDNATSDYTGTPVGLTYLTRAAWKTQSGLTADGATPGYGYTVGGFRRATTWPADWTAYDDPAFSYGYCQAGDIIGPWLFQDLRAGLQPFKWTAIPPAFSGCPTAWDNQGENNDKTPFISAASSTWALAQATVVTGWAAAAASWNQPPAAWTSGYYNSYGGTFYWPGASRRYSYIKATPHSQALLIPFDIDLYVAPASVWSGGTFDANGDAVKQGLWSFLETKTDKTGVIYSSRVGDNTLTLPTWCGDPTIPITTLRGYTTVGAPLAVWKWRFAFSL